MKQPMQCHPDALADIRSIFKTVAIQKGRRPLALLHLLHLVL